MECVINKKVITAREVCDNYLGGISRTTFYRFRRKHDDFPLKVPYSGGLLFRADIIERIATAFGINLADIFTQRNDCAGKTKVITKTFKANISRFLLTIRNRRVKLRKLLWRA